MKRTTQMPSHHTDQSTGIADGGRCLHEAMARLPSRMRPQAAPQTWETAFGMLPASGRVLNLGAGRGGISWLLHQAGYEVTSLDLHPEHFMAEGLTCGFADLNQSLPFSDGGFDVVLAVEVVEHLENPWHFMREAIRVLRGDGVLIMTTPNLDSLPSRLGYMFDGLFPYFREQSFVGCYHVSPIFPWTVERCCRTTQATVDRVAYSRVDWPRPDDVPRYDDGKGMRRRLLDRLPLNRLTGEIACYQIRKSGQAATVSVGVHYS